MRHIVYLLLAFIPFSCKEAYEVPINAARTNNLVVEGIINLQDTTEFRLSRSAALADTSVITPETGAQILVESDNGFSFPLYESAAGTYWASFNADPSAKYRVRINTNDGRQYESDFVPVVNTPPIDSISWEKRFGDVLIYANTHDSQNNTRYYRWKFEETWEFHSAFYSLFEYSNGAVFPRLTNNFYVCYNTLYSTNIILGSSAKLAEDIIAQAPVQLIPDGSQKLSVLYGIKVTQYSLTKDAYEYWDQLRKNTEKLGSIFDPQPSANKTNLRCLSNPNEMVIGYVSAGNSYEVRKYITNDEVLPWGAPSSCFETVVPLDSIQYFFEPGTLIPTRKKDEKAYYGAPPPCVDCTLTGTNIKPNFWPR